MFSPAPDNISIPVSEMEAFFTTYWPFINTLLITAFGLVSVGVRRAMKAQEHVEKEVSALVVRVTALEVVVKDLNDRTDRRLLRLEDKIDHLWDRKEDMK